MEGLRNPRFNKNEEFFSVERVVFYKGQVQKCIKLDKNNLQQFPLCDVLADRVCTDQFGRGGSGQRRSGLSEMEGETNIGDITERRGLCNADCTTVKTNEFGTQINCTLLLFTLFSSAVAR